MPPRFFQILRRAVLLKCPACGLSPVFEKGYQLKEICGRCGLRIRSRDPDTWFFMYGSTAAITGFFIVMLFVFKPLNPYWVRIGTVGIATVVFFVTMPLRKSIAVAFDYFIET